MADGLAEKVVPAFGDRGHLAIAALVKRDLPRTAIRYIVADVEGTVVGSTRLALRQEPSAAGIGPVAQAIGWRRTLRGALVLGLLVHMRLAPDEAYLEELTVSADHRRRGIGRALLAECEAVASSSGKARLTLWVTEENTSAIALYRSCGYRIRRRRRTIRGRLLFGAPVALLMEKTFTTTPAILRGDGTPSRTQPS